MIEKEKKIFRKMFIVTEYAALTVLLECKTEKRNSQCEHGHKRFVSYVRLRWGSLSITTPVPLLANEFDVRSVLHGQLSLAAVNQIYVFHEAMNGCKKKIYRFFKGLLLVMSIFIFIVAWHV